MCFFHCEAESLQAGSPDSHLFHCKKKKRQKKRSDENNRHGFVLTNVSKSVSCSNIFGVKTALAREVKGDFKCIEIYRETK